MGVFFAAALAAIPSINGVQAATINFSFSDDPTTPFFGLTHLGGTVTGTLYGLADDGFSMPTSILITSDASVFGISGNLLTSFLKNGSGFKLSNGTVVGADVSLLFRDLNNGLFQFDFNFTPAPNDGRIYNFLARVDGRAPIAGIGNQDGFGGVTYTTVSAVPELSTWAMLILGFASIGYVTYRRNCEMYDVECCP